MKKIIAILVIMMVLALGLTSMQAYAQPAFDSKTPGAKETEQSIERATEQAEEAAEKSSKKEEDKGGQKQNFKGTLVSMNDNSVTLKLDDGAEMTFTIASSTRVKIPGAGNGKGSGNGKKAPTTGEIQPGAKVMVHAVAGQTPMVARHVMVFPGKPAHSHHVGTVTEYSPDRLVIRSHDGQSSSFALASGIKILPQERAGELKEGSRVTVIYGRNPSGDAPVVRGIVVHPADSGPKGTGTPKP